jgi:hypothetical protein
MTIPSANIKWGDIHNVVNNTVHNGISPSINIGSYIGQVWSDNTSVPNKNISIGTHFRGKSMPSGGPEYPPGIIDIKNFETIILNEEIINMTLVLISHFILLILEEVKVITLPEKNII